MGFVEIKDNNKELRFDTKKMSINEVSQIFQFARDFFLTNENYKKEDN